MSTQEGIVQLADSGHSPAQIAASLAISPGYVYRVLREHRPERARAPRTRTTDMPRKVAALAEQGILPQRIAFLLQVSPAYVYRILAR